MNQTKSPSHHQSSIQSISHDHNNSRQKQGRKKKSLINIEVNKLFKNKQDKAFQPKKCVNIKRKNQQKQQKSKTQYISIQTYPQSTVESEKSNKKNTKVLKTFEQMYFEKLRQLKIQQNMISELGISKNYNNKPLDKQVNRNCYPQTCKNSSLTVERSKNQPNSTKNSSISNISINGNNQNNINRQNIQKNILNSLQKQNKSNYSNSLQKKSTEIDRFFKKVSLKSKQQKQNNVCQQNIKNIVTRNQKVKGQIKNGNKLNKPAQIKLNPKQNLNKKVNKIIKSSQYQLKNPRNSTKSLTSSIVSKKSPSPTCVNTVNTFKKPNTSQINNQKLCYSTKFDLNSSNQLQKQRQYFQNLPNLINTFIEHKNHEHVWGGVECFFSYDQLTSILTRLLSLPSIQPINNKTLYNNKDKNQYDLYINKIWQHLGGDSYGGVVKQNLINLMEVILSFDQQNETFVSSSSNLFGDSKQQYNFVDKSTLKLVQLEGSQRQYLVQFYRPIRLILLKNVLQVDNITAYEKSTSKDNQIIRHQSQLNKQLTDDYRENNNQVIHNQTSTKQILQNNVYLKSGTQSLECSQKTRQPQQSLKGSCIKQKDNFSQQKKKSIKKILSEEKNIKNEEPQSLFNDDYFLIQIQQQYPHQKSPLIINSSPSFKQKNRLVTEDSIMSDFSPKLSSQQYQPFRSTVLSKQENIKSIQPFYENIFNDEARHQLQKPLLSIDVNLGQGHSQKLIVYQGQTPYEVSLQLKMKYNIDEQLRQKFQKMLAMHLRSLLFKIQQVDDQLMEESRKLLNNSRNQNCCKKGEDSVSQLDFQMMQQ